MPITLSNGKTIIDMRNLSELFLNPDASKTKATPGLVSGPIPEVLLNNPNAAMIEIPEDSNIQSKLVKKLPVIPPKGLMISGGPIRPILLGDPQLSPKDNKDKEDGSQYSEKEDDQGSPFAPRRPEANLQLGMEVNKDSQLPGTLSQPNEKTKGIPPRHITQQQQQQQTQQPERDQEKKQQEQLGNARETKQAQPQQQQTRIITSRNISGYSQVPVIARVVTEKPSVRPSADVKLGEIKQRDDTHFAAGALTMLCKATTPPSSREHNHSNLPPRREQRNELNRWRFQQQQQRQHQPPPPQQQREDQRSDYASRKRHFVATLSDAPVIAHVPSRTVFRPRGDSMHRPPMTQPQEAHVVRVNANTSRFPQQGMGLAKKMRTDSVSVGFGQSLSKNDDYFFGVVSSHSGTRKMNSLGIPTMVVRLPQPQMHLMGFVVAGHVAWQAIANSRDQNNWTIARCLMCIRHPSALELMICDPTPIHPAIQHVYICPSHCVRRFIPNVPNLREQLSKDVISLPLSRPAPPNPLGTACLSQSPLTPSPPTELATVQARMPFQSFPQGRNQLKSLPNLMFMGQSETKEYICNMCNKEFSCKSSLNRHMRIHSGIKPYQCNTCGKKFADKGVLDVHERIHTGKKPYQCSECNKVFSQKGNLKRHMRIHSGDRPYKCNLCTKCFSQKGHLTAHLRIHTGQKPYTCEYCNKSFTQSSTLIGHKRTHTGERPYRCEICHKTFRQKGNLTAHMVMHQMHEDNESRLSMAPMVPETSSFSRQLQR